MDMRKILSAIDSAKATKPQSLPKKESAITPYIETIEQERTIQKQEKESQVSNLAESVVNKMYSADKIDSVSVDVPLLIRLLEYAKEDAQTDIDLHKVAEHLIKLSKINRVLTMAHYEQIVGDLENNSQID